MSQLAVTPRTKLKRMPQRGSFDRELVNTILDEAFVCHVSFLFQGKACLIPTVYARAGDWLVLHGATSNRALRALRTPGNDACISVTLFDSLVMARSAFHHSVNYRSVILYGQAEEVTEAADKMAALEALIEHVAAGRWKEIRQPNREELLRTLVLRVPIAEGSAKVRGYGVVDDAEDMALDVWAGLVPIEIRYGPPQRDPLLAAEIPLPKYLDGYDRKRRPAA
jgi:uncharacterized protein